MAAHAEIINTRNQSKRYERLFYTGMTIAFVITVSRTAQLFSAVH
jgi:hypothetical protein